MAAELDGEAHLMAALQGRAGTTWGAWTGLCFLAVRSVLVAAVLVIAATGFVLAGV